MDTRAAEAAALGSITPLCLHSNLTVHDGNGAEVSANEARWLNHPATRRSSTNHKTARVLLKTDPSSLSRSTPLPSPAGFKFIHFLPSKALH